MTLPAFALRGLVVLALAGVLSSCRDIHINSGREKLARNVVQQIERFRLETGRLPDSLGEIGIPVKDESDPPVYYEKRSTTRFVVWYGTRLGVSMAYDSQIGKWSETR